MISHRYFKSKKPFDINKTSFQDAIIWYSILEFVREHEYEGDVHFITNNSKDFADSSDHNKFHKEMEADLSEEEGEILHLYENIDTFLKKNDSLIHDCKLQDEEEAEEKIDGIRERVKDYIKSIGQFDDNPDINELVVVRNLIQDCVDNLLMNTTLEGEYDVGWVMKRILMNLV